MSLKKMLVSRAAVFAASLAVLVVALLFVGAKPAHAVTFEVNTTADTADPNTADNVCDVDSTTVGNQCTLRAAIDQANATGGADTLSFNIPTSDPNRNATTGVFTITPTSALPTITQQVTIDGYTQGDGTPADPSDDATPNTQAVGNDARLLIELNGASAGTPGRSGLRIRAGMSTVKGLVINRFSGVGISLEGNIAGGVVTNNKIEGNYIGTNAAGNAPLGNGSGVSIDADNNTIGGTDPAARNVISGNGDDGVSITQDTGSTPVQGILVQGNYIGTDAGGTADLGNRVFGVRLRTSSSTTIIGGRAAGAGNVISGNDQHGISLRDVTNHKILGNYIGTQANGTDPLGNSQAGIIFDIDASHNAVGGTRTGEPNVIAHNGNDGVSFGCCNRILSNSIYSNGTLATHLGIDLRSDGVSANDPDDADSGTNPLQNFPVLTSAERTDVDGSTTITGSLNSVPDEVFTVQFFSSPSPDPSNHGEGKTYLGLLTEVTTDLSGDASFSFTTQENLSGQVVTATATSTSTTDDNTSEFSAARAVSEANDPPVNSVPGAQSTNEDSALVFSQANSNRVSVSDPDAGTNPVQVRLQVDHGTMTLDGTGGLTFSAGDGTTDADMIFTGSLTDINAALDGMSFTPAANYNGGATLTITTDDQGNTGTGGAKTDTETVTLTVNAVNDAPSFTRGPKLSVQDKAGAQSVPNWATNISKGPANESAQTVSFIVTNDKNSLFTAQPAVSPDGTLTFTPAVNANGVANVQVVARDSGGTANGGDDTSDSQSFTIAVNDATAPKVKNTTPSNRETGVSPTANVKAIFSEAMNEDSVEATDPTTSKPTTFTLRRAGTTTTVAATVTYNATTRKAILNPTNDLRLGATYIATVTIAAKDLVGNALDQKPNITGNQPKTWRFTVRT